MPETSTIKLQRIVKAVERMRSYEFDYYYHHVGTAGPKMRKAQREVDQLIKEETAYLKSKQLEIL